MSDPSTIKGRQREMWGAGDYAAVATPLLIVSELLCEAADLSSGSRVLDVATGSGNTALAAARRRHHALDVRRHVRAGELDPRRLRGARNNFGPMRQTFERLEAPAQEAFASELLSLAARFNRSGDGTFVVPGEYVEAIVDV